MPMLAALGEYYFGEEKLPEDYIFVTLGTGVGGAAIIDKLVLKAVAVMPWNLATCHL